MSDLRRYEAQCREMAPEAQFEENVLAFREWRNSQRNEHLAYERWLVICGVRLEAPDSEEAEIIPFPLQRTEPLLAEGLE